MRWEPLLALAILAGCATPEPASPEPLTPQPIAHAPRATLHTSVGEIVLDLAREQAPVAVEHFLSLATSGFYDGTRFHRSWQGTLIQGGDPNSRTEDRATWGYGGQELAAPVELNPTLRHDTIGVVSFAGATGGSQFFITLTPKPDLDDRFPVFARVAEGMDVVERIAAAPNAGGAIDGPPLEPVVIERVSVAEPALSTPQRALALYAPTNENVVAPGDSATFALVVRNLGDARDNFTLTSQHANGWRVGFDPIRVELPAGAGAVVIVEVEPPAVRENDAVNVVVASDTDPSKRSNWPFIVQVEALDDAPRAPDRVRVDYTILTADGRLVDSTIERVDRANVLHPLRALGGRANYAPYEYTVGSGVVPAFDALVGRTPVGASGVARVPASEGYPDELLRGRELVFEVAVRAVVR